MITKKQYLEAKKIVDTYEAQLKRMESTNVVLASNLSKGERVRTIKGCRFNRCGFEGIVVGFGNWREYPAVKVRKDDGKIVMCLAKNLVRCCDHPLHNRQKANRCGNCGEYLHKI